MDHNHEFELTDRAHPAARRRDDLLDVAEALLDEGGFDALSVRRVAEAVDASRQVVYTVFGDMPGLLDGLHRRMSARLVSAIDDVGVPAGSTAHLVGATRAYLTAARSHSGPYHLMFERPLGDYVPGPEARLVGLRSFGHLVRAAGAWLGEGSTDGVEPADVANWPAPAVELARALWSTLHGFVVLERVGFATADETDALAERSVEALLSGWTGH